LRARKSPEATMSSEPGEESRERIKEATVSAPKASEHIGGAGSSRVANGAGTRNDRGDHGEEIGIRGRNRYLGADANTVIVSSVSYFILSANRIHRKVALSVDDNDIEPETIGDVVELVNGIEKADVEGVERAAGFAGRIVLGHRDHVDHAVSAVRGGAAGGTIGLRPATVEEESEHQHGRHFDYL